MGRPRFNPTAKHRKLVEDLAKIGTPQAEIAIALGISAPTLREYFRVELDSAATKANATIGSKLFDLAKAGNITAIIFWLKARAGWRDQPIVDAAQNTKPPDFVVELTGQSSADAATKSSLQ